MVPANEREVGRSDADCRVSNTDGLPDLKSHIGDLTTGPLGFGQISPKARGDGLQECD